MYNQRTMTRLRTHLKKLYYTTKGAASFSGVHKLFQEARKTFPKLKREQVVDWLRTQDAYNLHRPVRKHFQRNRVYVSYKDQQFEVDLVDIGFAKQNDGYRYLLTCIDVLSKYAWVVPLKSKSAQHVTDAFESILQQGRVCTTLHTDEGKEFYNKTFKDLLAKYHIIHFSSGNKDIKCAVVERFNRTLRTKLFRYFTANNTNRYIDVLSDIVASYNATTHRSIGMAPQDVTEMNEYEVWKKLYGGVYPSSKTCLFSVGDQVRLARIKGRFEQGYIQNWTDEIFVVYKCISRKPVVYQLKDTEGETVEGTFYAWELQKVHKDLKKDFFKVEKILDQKRQGRQTLYLVKYQGYPDKFNAWVPSKHLKKL